jgi:hypothetical protein
MKEFVDEHGRPWRALAREEDVPRHHGRWYLVLQPGDGNGRELMLPEVRWQTAMTAERSIRTMSDFELRRRVRMAGGRLDTPDQIRDSFGAWQGTAPGAKGGTAAG